MTLDSFLNQFGASLGQGDVWVSLGVAAAGGLVASAVCPCTLPVGLGMASITSVSETHTRRSGIAIAISFFLGIAINLMLLGAIAGRLGFLLTESFGRYWTLTMAAASFLAAFLAFRGPSLKVRQLEDLRRPGLAGAFAYGFIFSLGTSVAPLLLLLAIVASQASLGYGLALAAAFGIGRGLPFLVIGLFSSAVMQFSAFGAWRHAIQLVSVMGLVLVGVYYTHSFVILLEV